jgi:L-lactate dehydrogenase complex protein LldG
MSKDKQKKGGDRSEVVALFKEKAALVSAVLADVASPEEAFAYAADLCVRKEACQLLLPGCEAGLSDPARQLCDAKPGARIIAAPGLDAKQYKALEAKCKDRGIALVKDGLRNQLAGIDIGFTFADFGIAETGTLVLKSDSEETRLATMISEIHVAVLPTSKIKANSYDLEDEITKVLTSPPSYLAFLTGASRTADIERVLALGVHGPLELHILFWEDK